VSVKVSVTEIARKAEVSCATVFNYFPTKEDLVYQGMERFEAQMLDSLRNRPAGQSAVRAFGRFALETRGLLAAEDAESERSLVTASHLIASSPALVGLHASLVSCVRRRMLEEHPDRKVIARDVRAHGEKALRLLEKGLAGYGVNAKKATGT